MVSIIVFTMLLSLLLSVFFIFRGKKYSNKIPPGSFGLPLIGQSFSLLNALKADRVDEWFQKGRSKYGPIWKTNVLGHPTVILHGVDAHKFVYTCDGTVISNSTPSSFSRVVGPKNIFELVNDDHKRVRAAVSSFLRLEVLKQYTAKVDEEIQYHLQTHWVGKNEIQVQTLMKTLTFNVICSLIFGIERGPKREKLLPFFKYIIKGMLAVPINLPFTQFSRGITARKKLIPILTDLIQEKREALEQKRVDPHKDFITSLLSIRGDDNLPMMSDEEIIDNIIVVMIAGYDTTSILLTFLVRLLATNEFICHAIAREQEEIAKNKAPGEALTWEDLTKMKYTWRVASEMLRMYPPGIIFFKRAAQDFEYGGYIIPKGWQVLISASTTHMDDNIFQNPTMVNPTRFEKTTPTPPPPFSFVAFGAGLRMCPGMEFAKMEALAMMHRLVTQFTWVLVNNDEPFKRIPMPEFDKGLLARIMPIKASSLPSEAV